MMKLREICNAFKFSVLYRLIDQAGDETVEPLTSAEFWVRYRFTPIWDAEMHTFEVTRDADENILVVIYTQNVAGQNATLVL